MRNLLELGSPDVQDLSDSIDVYYYGCHPECSFTAMVTTESEKR